MAEPIPTDVHEMSGPQLWHVAYSEKFPRNVALRAQAEIWRREAEERGRVAARQERVAWASVATAGIAAIATVALAVISWVQTLGGAE